MPQRSCRRSSEPTTQPVRWSCRQKIESRSSNSSPGCRWRSSPLPTLWVGAISSGKRSGRMRSMRPATKSAQMNCRRSRSYLPKTTWWTSCWITRWAHGTPASGWLRIHRRLRRHRVKWSFVLRWRYPDARGAICASSRVTTTGGRPQPGRSLDGRRLRRR